LLTTLPSTALTSIASLDVPALLMEAVDRAELVAHVSERCLDRAFVGHVDDIVSNFGCGVRTGSLGLLKLFLVEIDQSDLGAFRGDPFRHLPAESLSGARNDDGFAL
jgi:hypothetical protein